MHVNNAPVTDKRLEALSQQSTFRLILSDTVPKVKAAKKSRHRSQKQEASQSKTGGIAVKNGSMSAQNAGIAAKNRGGPVVAVVVEENAHRGVAREGGVGVEEKEFHKLIDLGELAPQRERGLAGGDNVRQVSTGHRGGWRSGC